MSSRMIDLVVVQASSISWSGGTDACMRTMDGAPLLAHTLARVRAMAPQAPIRIAAPQFDRHNLDEIASRVSNCTVQYGFNDKPLLRLLQAAEGLANDAVVLRMDGQHSFFQEAVIWPLVERLHADGLDVARAPDSFPPGLTGDVWRAGALRKMARLLEELPADQAAAHYVHPKFLAMKPIAGLRAASIEPPALPDDLLREIREHMAIAFKDDHIEVTEKLIASGDQLSFHYRIASGYAAPGDLVLDIASGKGYGANMMAEQGCRVVCADIDQFKLDEGRKLFPREELTFSRQDIFDMSFADDTFDVVASMETMEHMADIERYLTQLRRVLRPDGLMILSTPQNCIGHIPLTPSHEKEYSLEEFTSLCGRYFHIERIIGLKGGTVFFDDDPVGANSMAILRKH